MGLAAVLASHRSFCAIGKWAADTAARVLAELAVAGPAPCETTIRRMREAANDAALARAVGPWLQNRAARRRRGHHRQVIAVSGKTTRGARSRTRSPRT